MMRRATRSVVTVIAAAALAVPAAAHGERAAGVTADGGLAVFDTATPGVATVVPIGPLTTPDESIVGIDVRPATGGLYGVSVDAGGTTRTYTIDPATGVAALAGSFAAPPVANLPTGLDFNPVVDRLRLAGPSNINLRIQPTNGALAATDTALGFAGAVVGPVTAVAYDRNVAGAAVTTLFAIDRGANSLVTIGGIDGVPSPNSGQVNAVGNLGVTIDANSDAGFDISPAGTAYASLIVGGRSRLYTINLTTGAATLVGTLPVAFRELAVLPPAPPPPDTVKPALLIAPPTQLHMTSLRLRGIQVPFSCSEQCTVTARLVGKDRTLGSVTGSLAAAGTGRVRIKLNASGRRALATTRRIALHVVAFARDPAGNVRTVRVRVLIV